MRPLLNYLLGYVTIIIRGNSVERFLNLAIQRGIQVWDIFRLPDGSVRAKVQLSGVRPLRHVARVSRCRFRIKGRFGVPFTLKFLQKRKMLVIGGIFFIAALYVLSSFIFFIRVTSPEPLTRVNPRMVERLAAEQGIKPGRPKWLMDFPGTEKYLINQIPQLTWVGISTQGTKLEIEIVEKVLPEPGEKDRAPGHIVAMKDGIISEILVMRGEPKVSPGETVSRGQILISGIILPEQPVEIEEEDREEQSSLGEPEKVKADGIIRARVWYRGYGECPLVEAGEKNTGRVKRSLAVRWSNRQVTLWGPVKSPFPRSMSDTKTRKVIWRNINLPVELIITNHWEQKGYRTVRSAEEAWQQAVKLAFQGARRQIPPDAKIVNREVKAVENGTNILKRAYVILETEEDIGKFIPIEEKLN